MHESQHFLRESNDYDFKYAFEERLLKIESALTSSVKDRPYSVYNLKNLKQFSSKKVYRFDKDLNNLSKYSFENLEELDCDIDPFINGLGIFHYELNSKFFDMQSGFRNLKTLDFSLSWLHHTWKFGTFENLKNLKSLKLYKVKQLDISTLINCIELPNLENLDLSCSNYTYGFDVSFQKFKKLKSIDLQYGVAQHISANVFKGLINLKKLNLKRSHVNYIEPQSFDDLVQLEFLNLSENPIDHLDCNLFKNLRNLKFFYISGDRITNFRILNSNNLEKLEIGGNEVQIDEMGSIFKKFSNLKSLKISGLKANKLSKEMFSGLSSLKVLKVYRSDFVAIDNQTFEHLKDLEILGLASNQKLNSLSAKCFIGLNNLRELDLCNCGLTDIQVDTFSNLTKLENLDLSSNKLVSIQYNRFCKLINLEYLNINFNSINITGENFLEINKINTMMKLTRFDYERQKYFD